MIHRRCIPLDLMKRYAFGGDTASLFARVVDHIAPGSPILSKMHDAKFIPAGNTLMAGVQPLAPNCAILGEITMGNLAQKRRLFVRLLSSAIGVGLDLTGTHDPVCVLRLLAKDATDISLPWDRPLRGNMATLSIEHPLVRDFIACKNDLAVASDDLRIFNISVAVTDRFMRSLDTDAHNRDLFETLCRACHHSGDPGLVFIDRAQFAPPLAIPGERIVTCVPCGEQFMYEGETCTLGALNLDRFVDARQFDWGEFRETIHEAVFFLDSVIDKLVIPDDEMAYRTRALRRIGLGVMGFANLLASMQISYESIEALEFASLLARRLTQEAVHASEELARRRGPHQYSTTRRNISVTCLQPTGGIRRLVEDDGFSIEPFFREATRITPVFSVQMAAVWQEHIENAVSKTVNLSNMATPSSIGSVYRAAYRYGCKGITVYRDGCRENQPIGV